MDAHGIEILDRTNDDAVVVLVSNDLHLKLFPTNKRFIDKQLIGWRQFETALTNGLELHTVVSNTTAGATHGKGRANDAGKTDLFENTKRFLQRMSNLGARRFQPDLLHRDIELFAVLSFIDGLLCSANHLDTVLRQYAFGVEFQGAVQRCLTAHGRKQGTWPLFFDNFGDRLPFNGLDISRIGHGRVRHDGGGV